MSELQPHQPETHHNNGESGAESVAAPSAGGEILRSKNHPADDLHRIQQSIEKHARTSAEINISSQENKRAPAASHPPNSQIKQLGFDRNMVRIRKKMPAAEKAFSQAMHQPAIEAASETAGRSVARPSGILGGSILAFAGSSALLWSAKHYGFNYNYLAFFLLFITGFGLGVLIEFIIKLIRKNR